jgi:hypothetical protein
MLEFIIIVIVLLMCLCCTSLGQQENIAKLLDYLKIAKKEDRAQPAYYTPDLNDDNKPYQLIITLALAASSNGDRIYKARLQVIQQWIEQICDDAQEIKTLNFMLENAVTNSAQGFDIDKICTELRSLTGPSERYAVIELCLLAVSVSQNITKKDTHLLTNIAQQLGIWNNKTLELTQKLLKITNHKFGDINFLLGLSNYDEHEVRIKLLNNQYRKWNNRVTHPDPKIRHQAETMLQLIAKTREQTLSPAC